MESFFGPGNGHSFQGSNEATSGGTLGHQSPFTGGSIHMPGKQSQLQQLMPWLIVGVLAFAMFKGK